MKRIPTSLATLGLSLLAVGAHAQITGVVTVPGTYATLTAAVADLNLQGVGTGGATVNVAAGYTETLTGPLVLTMSTAGPSAANPLTIQRSGTGANPLLTAFTGTGTLDGMFILNGVDFVTISGIDLQENAANTTATTQMEWGYALLKTGALNGAQNNTIQRSTVTLNQLNTASVGVYVANHTTTSATALTLTVFSGTNSNNRFFNNTVTNCYTGYSITGFAAAAPFDLYDQNNRIGTDGVSTRRSQVTQFGGGTLVANGVNATAQNRFRVFNTFFNNTGGAIHTGALNGINISAASNADIDIYNDTLTLTSNATTGNLFPIVNSAGAAGAGNTINIYNNVVDGCTYPTATSGIFRGITSTGTATTINVYNNRVTNNTLPGTGEFSGLSLTASSVNIVLLQNIYDNIVSGNTKTGTSGTFNMINASGSTVVTNFYNNQLFNNSAINSSSAMYGYFNFAFGLQENIYNNLIYNNAGGTGEVTMIHARSGSSPTNKEIYGNLIHTISSNSASSSLSAIWVDYGTVCNVYRNTIYNLNNTTTGTPTPATVGIQVGSNVSALVTVHNNMISDLRAPNASSTFACIMGIWLNGALNGSVMNAYYNTVYLNATGTGANFGSSALYIGPNAFSTDIRNNIFVNVSNATGTGLTRCITRSTVATTSYAITSGYNCLWAGTPSATNLIYSDFTNNDQTIQAFKNRVGPREQSSFSELPPFVNVATTPYDLHLQTSVPTQCQGGGTPVAGITIDFDNNTRSTTLPDIGADEFNGVTVDLASPNIVYNPLTNSSVAATRVLNTFATITDPSGINTTAGTRPRIYYKRSTNANTVNTNTNATDGWKFVEASNTTSPFSFTIDYSLLFGGGVVAGDVIQYFVVAQDLNGTPRIGLNNGGFTTQPTSVNLSAANFPLTNTINQYTIVAAPLSGTINVGPAEAITSLTNTGGIFQLINSATLSGNVVVNVTGDLTAETGTVALNQWAEEGAGNYTVTIQPSAAVVRTISGSNSVASLIRFDGADRVTMDGRFGGTGTFFLLRNTSNSAPTVGFLNDAQNNTIRNCTVESGNTTNSAALGGAIHIGGTTLTAGNDNITITFCDIRDRSDVAGTPVIGINCQGTLTSLLQFNNNVTISNNNIRDWFLSNSNSQFGLNIGGGNTNFTITGNSFYQTATRTNTVSGAVTRAININFTAPINTNGGHTISNNFIGGTAPGATGGDMTLTVSGSSISQAFLAISVVTGLIPNNINGNIVRRIDFTTQSPSTNSSMFIGINLGQGVHNVGTISGNVIGDATGNDHIKININTGGTGTSFLAGILAATANGSYTISGNTVGGITINGTTTSTSVWQGIQIQGTPSATSTVNNNLVGSTTTANSIRNLNALSPVIGFGIRQLITSGAALNLTNNTVQGYSDGSTAANSQNFGILLTSTVGGAGTLTVTGNTVRNQAIAAAPPTPVLANIGIAIQNMAGNTHNFTSNVIGGISNTNTGAFAGYAVGVQTQGSTLGGILSRNQIWDITNANTGACGIAGIYFSSGSAWTVSNNMISLTNGANTNNVDLTGITDVMAQSNSGTYYYNSIYIGGTVTAGASNTSALNRLGNATMIIRNNLLVNTRTGGTGNHIAISNAVLAPAVGWNAAASSNNAFVVSDTTRVGLWSTTTYSLGGWRTISGGDLNSVREISTTVTPAALFVNTAIGDLHNNTSIFPEAVGTPIAGLTIDFDNQTRSTLAPTAGADERACSPIVFSVASQTNVSCNGGTNGSVTLGGTGGNFITYSWAPSGGNTATATGLAAGTYTCTISNACGSTGSVTVTITQPAVLAATSTSTNVSCNGGTNGSATVSPTGGTPGYTYSWAPSGGTAATATGLAAGTYTCTITDANGCTTTRSVSLTQPSALSVTSSQTNLSCNGGSNGSATVSVSGGTPGYTYNWAPSGGTAATATGLAATNYTCTITDANGCSTTQSVTLTEPTALSVTSSQTNISCNGGSNGSATVSVSGGTPGYTYSWAPSGGTAATASGLAAGTYVCTITDANGCSTTQSVTLTEPTALSVTSLQTNVSCNGGNDGTATVNVSGGTPGYTYNWAPSGGTAATATGLAAGTYVCTITDANGCSTTQSVTLSEPSPLSVTSSQTNVSCNGGNDGTATVAVTGGTPGYSYIWSNGDTTATATGLPANSVVTCTITDANGCVTTFTTTLTEPSAIAAVPVQTGVSCNGGSDGSASVTVSGGTPGYTYLWNTGDTTASINGVSAAVYTVTITDANGCTVSQTVTVTQPAPLATTVVAAVNPTSCAGSNGSIDISVNGGTGPYSFTWSNSANTEDISGLTAGFYSVLITDANGCTDSTSATLNDPALPTVTYAEPVDTACQNLAVPFALTGGSPAGGVFSGTAVNNGIFDPAQATLGYNVITYTYTDPSGCVGTSTDSVWVEICGAVGELGNGPAFTLFPNPSNGSFTLQLGTETAANVEIYDMLGKLVIAQRVQTGTLQQFRIEANGTYFVTVITNDGRRSTQRVVITD